MIQANQEIREDVKNAKLKLWQIADEYGMSDANFSRKLRKEFTNEEKKLIQKIINKLRKDNKSWDYA